MSKNENMRLTFLILGTLVACSVARGERVALPLTTISLDFPKSFVVEKGEKGRYSGIQAQDAAKQIGFLLEVGYRKPAMPPTIEGVLAGMKQNLAAQPGVKVLSTGKAKLGGLDWVELQIIMPDDKGNQYMYYALNESQGKIKTLFLTTPVSLLEKNRVIIADLLGSLKAR